MVGCDQVAEGGIVVPLSQGTEHPAGNARKRRRFSLSLCASQPRFVIGSHSLEAIRLDYDG